MIRRRSSIRASRSIASYRINKDNGQGNRLADPTGTPGTLISSYPMSFQSPEARLAIKINKRLDWNLGYQYYNYNESALVGPGRRTITRICPIRRCAFTLVAENSCAEVFVS